MKIMKKKSKYFTLAALMGASTALPNLATVVSADEALSFTAPEDVVYTLHSSDSLVLGSANAKGIPNDATDAKITNDAASVLNVDANGNMQAGPGNYIITYTLSYKQDGVTHVNKAYQKVTILPAENTNQTVPNSGQAQNLGDKGAINKLVSGENSNAASATSNVSSVNSNISSAASSVVSSGNSLPSSVVSSTSSVNSDAASPTDAYQTVTVTPDMTLTNYLNAALNNGLTGDMKASITSGIKDNGNGTTPSEVQVAKNGTITITHALKDRVNGVMTTTFSNGVILTSTITNGVMETKAQNPNSSAVSSMGSSAASSAVSSANSAMSSASVGSSNVSSTSSNTSGSSNVSSTSSNTSGSSNVSSTSSNASSSSNVSSTNSNASGSSNVSSTSSNTSGSSNVSSTSSNTSGSSNASSTSGETKLESSAVNAGESASSNAASEQSSAAEENSGVGSAEKKSAKSYANEAPAYASSGSGSNGSGSTGSVGSTSGSDTESYSGKGRLPQTGSENVELAVLGAGIASLSLGVIATQIRKRQKAE